MNKITKILIAAFAVVAFTVSTASAAYTHTSLLKQGSRGASVMELQKALNMTSCQVAVAGKAGSPGMETSYFGPATTAAVKCFQNSMGDLVTDGLVGKNTGGALATISMGGGSGLPAGCTSTSGFSSTTGQPCNTGGSTVLPPGCTTSAGYSPVTGQSCAGGNTTPQTGPVSASLSATTPAAGYIINNQATAGLLDVMFTGNGTVNSVTLTRSGISDQNTLSNVYLYDGVQRLTDGFSFNSTGQITMNNLNLAVNGSRTISVKADASSTASSSSTIAIALTSYSSGTSVNTVNIQGNLMNLATSGSIAQIGKSGSNTVGSGSVNAGTSSYTVWRQAFQVNTRAVWLKAANFRISGSAPADALQNVGLYVDGVKAGNNATMTMTNGSNYLSFDMSAAPTSLTTGSHTVEVRGDVVKGSSFSFTVSLQQSSDLMVMDPQVGVNIAVCGDTTCTTSYSASTAGAISIGTGSFTAVVDPTFSSMTNVTASASNVTIAKFKLHGYGEDVKVTSLPITTVLSGSAPAAAGLQNLTVYFNGSQVGTQLSQAIGLNTFNLGSQMIVPAGVDSTLEIRADLRTTGGTSYTAGNISANLGAATAEGWNSKASITGPTATGTILAMQSGTLALSKNNGYSSQNANPNTAGVKIGSFVLQNQSTSESIRVTTLSILNTYGVGTASSNLSGLRTSETSGNAGTPVQPSVATGTVDGTCAGSPGVETVCGGSATNTFSSDFILAPGAVKTIDVFADSSSDAGATATVISTLTVTSIGSVSNVSATSSATAGQTITFRTGTLNAPTVNSASSTVAQLVAAANGGTADGSLAQYNFTSTDASSVISELTFVVTSGTATSVKVNGVTAPVVGGVAYLTGLSIPVPNGGSGANISVYVSYPEVGTSGVASATTSTLALITVKSTSGNTTTTTNVSSAATTYTSGTVTLGAQTIVVASTAGMLPGQAITIAGATTAVGTITSITNGTTVVVNITTAGVTPAGAVTFYGTPAPSMTLVGSKPAYVLSGSTDTLLNGSVKIAEVTVTADAKGDIKIGELPITVTSTGVAAILTGADNIVVKDTSGATIATRNAALAVAAGGSGSATICFDDTTASCGGAGTVGAAYLIPAGTSKTFRIYVTASSVAGAVNTTSLSTKLGAASSANYYDVAGGATAAQAATLLYGYPTDSVTIHN
ncbi:MAG: peptidoglycan-binding protein [Candidatus Pacebacteria bacterium]|nr:peptidoglycan-binding protein [Candidatus Paceibacterota bacterium]